MKMSISLNPPSKLSLRFIADAANIVTGQFASSAPGQLLPWLPAAASPSSADPLGLLAPGRGHGHG